MQAIRRIAITWVEMENHYLAAEFPIGVRRDCGRLGQGPVTYAL